MIMRKSVFFRLLLCALLFLLTFAGKSERLDKYNDSFYRSRHSRPDITQFQGLEFGMTLKEFKQFCEDNDSIKMLGDTTIDRGRVGRRRLKVYLKGKDNAGDVLGDVYLFGIKYLGHERLLGHAFFTPGDDRLHAFNLYFPDYIWSDIGEIETTARKLFQLYSEKYGVPDYVSGIKNDDWGPQKDIALTKKNLNHPKRRGAQDKPFAIWCHHNGEWKLSISGVHFEHVDGRYQVVVRLFHNYTKGF